MKRIDRSKESEAGAPQRADLYPALTDHEIGLLIADLWADDPLRAGAFKLDPHYGNRLCVTLEQLLAARLALRLGFGEDDQRTLGKASPPQLPR
jgi:hypothetical protein